MPIVDRNHRTKRKTRAGKQPAKRKSGGCVCGHCWQQPSPDEYGRVHCDRCGCFTAAVTSTNPPAGRHRWCHMGMTAWTNEEFR